MHQNMRLICAFKSLVVRSLDRSDSIEQFTYTGDIGGAVAIGKEALVSDVIHGLWRDSS